MEDWFYGATASFPKAIEWHIWHEYAATRLGSLQPMEKFLVDATLALQQLYVKVAQRVRKNLNWTRQYTEDEMTSIVDLVGTRNAWYSRNRPTDDAIRNLDPILVIQFKALDGAYAVASALCQELDQINRKGFVLVDTSAEAIELDRAV